MVLEKALFLAVGTVIGVAFATLILGTLTPYRWLAVACMALIIGLTSAAAATVRHGNFAFVSAVISVTTAMVILVSASVSPQIDSKGIFDIVISRLSEVAVGSTCAVLVSFFVFPANVDTLLKRHAGGIVEGIINYLAMAFESKASQESLHSQAKKIINSISLLNDDCNAARYEGSANIKASRHLSNKALSILSMAGSQIQIFREPHRHLQEPTLAIFDYSHRHLRGILGESDPEARLEQVKTAKEGLPDNAPPSDHPSFPTHAFVSDTIKEIFNALEHLVLNYQSIGSNSYCDEWAPRPRSFRDLNLAATAALRSVLVFLACIGVWIVSGGPSTLVMMVIVPTLFSQVFASAPSPPLATTKVTIGGLLAIPIALLSLGALAEGNGNFEILILALSPPLFVALMAMTHNAIAPYGLGFSINYAILIQPSNQMSFSAEQSLNTGVGIAAGMIVLLTAFMVIKRPSGKALQRRIIKSIALDLQKAERERISEEDIDAHISEKMLYLVSNDQGDPYSQRLTALGFLGLELAHTSARLDSLFRNLSDQPKPLMAWQESVIRSYLECLSGRMDDRFQLHSRRIVKAIADSPNGALVAVVFQGMLERMEAALNKIAASAPATDKKYLAPRSS